jgi:hypothetical protein
MSDDQGEWLDVKAAAARAGVKPVTWRSYVSRGYAPEPDDKDEGEPVIYRRRPRWRASTLDGWRRAGQGAHTELAGRRAAVAAARRAELAEPAVVAAHLQAWLSQHHPALLAAAEDLVDLRDALVAADKGGLLADAIDKAGEAMTRQPSIGLASAVSYALSLARGVGEDAAPLARFDYLRTGYESVRPLREV